jgi:hypothetical protein
MVETPEGIGVSHVSIRPSSPDDFSGSFSDHGGHL